jgi:DNA-binding transcriptional ArsR family regulator
LNKYIFDMLETMTAIAEPNRFEIIELLKEGPRSVNEISERIRLRQPQVSKHLHVLKAAGIVEMLPMAQLRIYSLRAEPFEELASWLDTFKNLWNDRLDTLESVLDEIKRGKNRE